MTVGHEFYPLKFLRSNQNMAFCSKNLKIRVNSREKSLLIQTATYPSFTHKVSGGVHLDVGVLGLPQRVSMHGIEQLVNGGGLRGQMQKLKAGELEAAFPPQICGPSLPPKIRVARGAAQVDVNDVGGEVEGCCPAHNIVHPHCTRLVGRLLQLVVGDGEGLVLRSGVSSRIGAGLQGGELRQSLLRHGHKKRQINTLGAVRKRNSGNRGEFT